MRKRFTGVVLMAFIVAVLSAPVIAQMTATVHGIVRDTDGKPITQNAVVEWTNGDTGQKYTIKVTNKGDYFSLGITPGRYTVKLIQDGKELYHFTNVPLGVEEKVLDIDLKKEMSNNPSTQMTPEQKAAQEQQAKAAKENNTIKALNEKLLAAKASSDAGNYDAAIATLTEATQMDATRDLIWAKLGEANLISAPKQTDTAEKTKRFDSAAQDYQKAIDLKQQGMDTDPKQKTPDATKVLAQYYNNLGQAQGKTGKTDDAQKSYTKAAELDPTGAAQYYYNLGATMVNTGKTDDAIAAFDKAIAADPNKADAYYQKGVCLVGKASTDKDGKVTPVPGTVEAFNKYLELQPTGPNADASKSMLQYIGSTVETSFGKPKGKPVKK